MNEIYKQVKAGGRLVVHRTPHQLNQMLMEPTDTIYPERYLPEINIITCKPSLVVKNWAYAANNLPTISQEEVLHVRLKQIFAKYASLANIDWPKAAPAKRSNGALQQQQEHDEKQSKLDQFT